MKKILKKVIFLAVLIGACIIICVNVIPKFKGSIGGINGTNTGNNKVTADINDKIEDYTLSEDGTTYYKNGVAVGKKRPITPYTYTEEEQKAKLEEIQNTVDLLTPEGIFSVIDPSKVTSKALYEVDEDTLTVNELMNKFTETLKTKLATNDENMIVQSDMGTFGYLMGVGKIYSKATVCCYDYGGDEKPLYINTIGDKYLSLREGTSTAGRKLFVSRNDVVKYALGDTTFLDKYNTTGIYGNRDVTTAEFTDYRDDLTREITALPSDLNFSFSNIENFEFYKGVYSSKRVVSDRAGFYKIETYPETFYTIDNWHTKTEDTFFLKTNFKDYWRIEFMDRETAKEAYCMYAFGNKANSVLVSNFRKSADGYAKYMDFNLLNVTVALREKELSISNSQEIIYVDDWDTDFNVSYDAICKFVGEFNSSSIHYRRGNGGMIDTSIGASISDTYLTWSMTDEEIVKDTKTKKELVWQLK